MATLSEATAKTEGIILKMYSIMYYHVNCRYSLMLERILYGKSWTLAHEASRRECVVIRKEMATNMRKKKEKKGTYDCL